MICNPPYQSKPFRVLLLLLLLLLLLRLPHLPPLLLPQLRPPLFLLPLHQLRSFQIRLCM